MPAMEELVGPRALAAGVRIGDRYRLDDLVDEAHGTSVWKGTDEVLARQVTVRIFMPRLSVPDGVIAAVRAAAKLNDSRLVRIFDADYRAEFPYLITEWVSGQAVDDLVAAGLPGPAVAAAIVADAAETLTIAHAAGRPHLCLMPQSLRWADGNVKITGLGIEAALADAVAADPAAADTRALGRILYALLTGYWPGDQKTTLPPAPRHRGQLYSPRQVRAGIPGILDAITCRALVKAQHPRARVVTPAPAPASARTSTPGRHGQPGPDRRRRWLAQTARDAVTESHQ